MRLVARVPADRGVVRAVTVQLRYAGTDTSDGVDVTDVQLQPGNASGVVPHPSEVSIRAGGVQWRNGVIPADTDEVLILANSDRPAPTKVTVKPSAPSTVRVGAFRFGRITGAASANGVDLTATTGHGRLPLLTERSDGHVAVITDHPLHMTVGWSDRS